MVIPLGLNLAALAFLGAILAAGGEPGGLGARWQGWLWYVGPAAGLGLFAFRFPRSVGLPSLAAVVALTWLVVGALKDFVPLDPAEAAPAVQPLTDREMVTAFALRVDLVAAPPDTWKGLPTLYRLRPSGGEPAEWWWSWAAAQGWARSTGAGVPESVVKFGVYRWAWADNPHWRLERPELTPPP